jgi:hypothetical protein
VHRRLARGVSTWSLAGRAAAGGGHDSSAGRHAMISRKAAEHQTPPRALSLSVCIDRGDYRASPPLSLCVSVVDGKGAWLVAV